MYEKFVLRKFEKGIIRGYRWPLDDPDKVVCIVHGIGEYGGRFDRVAEAFRAENMAVMALDLRGHGDSIEKKGHCAPRNKVLEDVSVLLEYAEKTYPGKPLILYGHSMGGNIVLDYRARGMLNGLPSGYIIAAPWVRLVRPVPKPLYGLMKMLARIMPTMTVSSDVNEADLGHPESVKPYKENPMTHNRISAQCAVDGFEIGLALEDGTAEDDLRAAAIPTPVSYTHLDVYKRQHKKPFYRVVVADIRAPRDGKFIEEIGYYNPLTDPVDIKIDEEKAKKWLGNGAQPTDTVKKLFKQTGIL